jgi:hypothetical protein
VRHWPKGEINVTGDVDAAVGELTDILKRNIGAVAQRYALYTSLTAGRDSRMLLACAREHLDGVELVLFGVRNPWGQLDAQVAPKIARKFGLRYGFLPFEQPSEAEVNDWLDKTGHCITGAQWVRTYNRLDPDRAVCMGAGGELGRGFHWRDGDTESSPISVDDLMDKRELIDTPEIRHRCGEWLERLGVKNSLTVWGLLYNELFNGCWFGPLLYGFTSSALHILPFSHRRIIEIMLSLPTDYRRDNMLPIDVIKREWPELLRFPFNWPIGIRRYLYAIHWRVDALRRKLRSRGE